MAVPTPPTAGEPIAEAWGDVVHDAVVAQDIQAGIVSVPFANTGAVAQAVTFPRPFAAPPTVMLTGQWVSGVTGMGGPVCSFQGGLPTTTGFTARIANQSGAAITTTVPVQWIAYGPRA